MPIRFAPARPATIAHFAVCPRRIGAFRAANDNAGAIAEPELLRAALLHFAQHGLGAAEIAAARAVEAKASGNDAGSGRWLDICRTFDRRLAERASLARRGNDPL